MQRINTGERIVTLYLMRGKQGSSLGTWTALHSTFLPFLYLLSGSSQEKQWLCTPHVDVGAPCGGYDEPTGLCQC